MATSLLCASPLATRHVFAATPQSPVKRLYGQAFGSTWSLILPKAYEQARALRLINAVVDEINQLFSPYLENSALSGFNRFRQKGSYSFPLAAAPVLQHALKHAAQSKGIFDPTVGPAVARMGFGPISSTIRCSYNDLESSTHANQIVVEKLDLNVTLDCCGLAKGYALDLIATRLKESGYADFFLELGGEVLAHGYHPDSRPWRVAVEKPAFASLKHAPTIAEIKTLKHYAGSATGFDRNTPPAMIIELDRRSIATSGTYQQGYTLGDQRYHHIIDPKTGAASRTTTVAASVLHENAMHADCWSTTLLACSHKDAVALISEYKLSAVLQTFDGNALNIEIFGSVPHKHS